MKKTANYRVGSLIVAALAAGLLVPGPMADAAERFSCPTDTDSIEVPFGWDGDTPLLAGTVCVVTGTTRLVTLDTAPGWTAAIRSDGTNTGARTDIRFTQTDTGDRVELIYEPGRTRIK